VKRKPKTSVVRKKKKTISLKIENMKQLDKSIEIPPVDREHSVQFPCRIFQSVRPPADRRQSGLGQTEASKKGKAERTRSSRRAKNDTNEAENALPDTPTSRRRPKTPRPKRQNELKAPWRTYTTWPWPLHRSCCRLSPRANATTAEHCKGFRKLRAIHLVHLFPNEDQGRPA